jgi:hypothetical protein
LDAAVITKPDGGRARPRSAPGGIDAKLAGIVGRTLFHAGTVEVDYRRHLLHLYQPGTYKYRAGDVTLPVEVDSEFLFLETSIESRDNGAKARLVVDTGAKTALSLKKQFAERNRLMPRASELITGRECGAAGDANEPTLIGEIAALRFGPLEVLKPRTVFYEETEKRWYDGLLGNDAFRGFRAIIDLQHLRLTLRRAK